MKRKKEESDGSLERMNKNSEVEIREQPQNKKPVDDQSIPVSKPLNLETAKKVEQVQPQQMKIASDKPDDKAPKLKKQDSAIIDPSKPSKETSHLKDEKRQELFILEGFNTMDESHIGKFRFK